MIFLIKQATILDSRSKHHLKRRDILVKDGRIEKIAANLPELKAKYISGKNLFVSNGWVDLFVDFCEPGNEQNETLQSGSLAAVQGGFTDVVVIPNTQPCTQNKAQIEFIKSQSNIVNLHALGAISKNLEGKDLAEMYDMKLSGAVAFSDGKKTIQHSGLLLKALQYVKTFEGLIIEIPKDDAIGKYGLMHEGEVSTQLGMSGIPDIAEHIAIQKSLELLHYTKSKLHFTGISTKRSVALIREAKKKGLNVTCSVNIHHLLYTDQCLKEYDSHFKIFPPLRTAEDQTALLKGLEDGSIDAITSHHSPQNWDAKQQEFEYAKEGMIGLQTMLPMLVTLSKKISVEQWIKLLTDSPREILGLTSSPISEGEIACLTCFSPSEMWEYNQQSNKSKSQNSPVFGQSLMGKVKAVFNNEQAFIHE